jgi:quinolinate synthase
MEHKTLVSKIKKLKKKKNAVILVHNYQRKEIYEVADFIGDSLELAKKAANVKADIIVFCGVDFMAETAKILSPNSKVLLPAKDASCPMANMLSIEKLRELKTRHPSANVVAYVNTTAEIKAEAYICCTSVNCVDVVNSVPSQKVIFVPDANLSMWVRSHIDKQIISCEGFCYVHDNILVEQIKRAKELHPDAKVMAHPEAKMEILKLADHVTGTGGMIEYAKTSDTKEFIVATEEGMINRLEKEVPDKTFYAIGGVCFNMKKNSLEKVYEALDKEQYEIHVDEEIAKKAKVALDRMIKLCNKK